MVIKFDGHDIKEMHDLPRIVADTPVGKEVDVVVIRKGKEETHKVKIGRLEDGEKLASRTPTRTRRPSEKSIVQKTLGLELSSLSDDLRKKFKISDNVKGVLITGVDPSVASRPPDKRLSPGDVIVEVQYQGVGNPTDLQKRIDQLKNQGKKVAVLLVVQCRRRDALRRAEPAVRPLTQTANSGTAGRSPVRRFGGFLYAEPKPLFSSRF